MQSIQMILNISCVPFFFIQAPTLALMVYIHVNVLIHATVYYIMVFIKSFLNERNGNCFIQRRFGAPKRRIK